MAMSLVSFSLSSSSHGHPSTKLFHTSASPFPTKPQNLKFTSLSISPPSSDSADSLVEDSAFADTFPPSGCKACGKEEIERGCNGEGRIQGGIATVPGFGWWPIKAYRPCPAFVASGGRYSRRGQSMDEVAFGRGSPAAPPPPILQPDSEGFEGKKGRDQRGFKR